MRCISSILLLGTDIMGFYYTVVLEEHSGVRTVLLNELEGYNYHDLINNVVRNALPLRITKHIEVYEMDTQLYGLPVAERTYPKYVLHPDGRLFQYYGANARSAHLVDGFDTRMHMHTFRV